MQNKTKQIIAISILGLALLGVGVFGLLQVKKDNLYFNKDILSTKLINNNLTSDDEDTQLKNTTKTIIAKAAETDNFKKEIPNSEVKRGELKNDKPPIIKELMKETIIKVTDNTPQQQLNYDKNSVLQDGDYLKCLKDEHILQWSAGDNEWDCVRPGETVFGKAVAEKSHGIRETSTGVVYCDEENNLLVWEDDSWRCKPYNNSGANTDEQVLNFDIPNSFLSISNGNTVDLSSLENTDILDGLNCHAGEIAKWNGVTSQWECAVDAGGVGSTTFRGLTDTPNNYGANGYLVQTDGVGTLSFIDPSGYLDNTDNQALSIIGHTISLVDGGSVTVPDNDNQDLSYNGATNILSLTNDGTTVDLSGLSNSGTDDQVVDVFGLTGTMLNLSLESDGAATYTVDLASLGATTFIGLTDTPAAYTANYLTRVNAAGSALEFVDGDGIYHRQGGNSYGLLSTLGTNDNFGLALETSNTTRATFDTAGNLNTTVNIIPTVDDTYNLGSATNRWQDLYLGPQSLHIGTNGDEGVLSFSTVNQVFDIDHALNLGTTTSNVAGNLRWTGADFEGHNGTNWVSLTSGGGGTSTFLALTDTPAAYTANYLTRVNAAGNALEFVDGDGIYHKQGGNSYGTTSILGTNDNYSLAFETNGTTKINLTTHGNFVPTVNNSYNMGSSTNRWQELYVGAASDIGGGTSGPEYSDEGIHLGRDGNDSSIKYVADEGMVVFASAINSSSGFQFLPSDSTVPILNIDTTHKRVGIGTETPSSDLEITGDMRLRGEFYDKNNQPGISGQVLSSTGTGTDWIDAPGGGVSTFLALTDTPAAYTANYLTRVNAAGDALEFVDGDGIYHKQGGNSYGTTSILGTNDNFVLALETNNITRATFDTTGNLNTTVNIIPTIDDTYNLGDTTHRWQDLYLGPASLHIGTNGDEGVLSYNTVNDTFDFDHAINLGTTVNATAGNVRWTGTDFEGYDGTTWKSFTAAGGGGTPAGATGAIQFNNAGAFGADDANLFWDDTNDRLGIGTATPVNTLQVDGDFNITGAFRDHFQSEGTPGQILSSDGSFPVWIDPTAADDGDWEIDGSDLEISVTGSALLNSNRSATRPALTFKGHTTAGINYGDSDAEYMSLVTNGVDRVKVTSWGTVGIGLAGGVFPVASLEVDGDGKFTDTLTIGAYTLPNTDGTNGQVLKTDGSGALTWQNSTGGADTDWVINGNDLEIGVSGQARFNINQNESNPAISFESHTNAGINYQDSEGGSMDFITDGVIRMMIDDVGSVGIGTTSPSVQLHTTGSVRFQNFGAGTMQTDADGNVSVSSDERLKNIQGIFDRGLEELLSINPIEYKWKDETGYDTRNSYYGFSAQNVKLSIPEAVGEDSRGYLTLSDRPILATAINAIKELNQKQGDQDISIIANTLKTDTNIQTLTDLQTSVDENLTIINQTLLSINSQQETIDNKISVNTENLATLSDNINSLTELTTGLVDTVNNHEERIARLEETLNSNPSALGGSASGGQTPALANLSESLNTFSDNLIVIQEEDTDKDGNIVSKQIFSLSGDLIVERLKAKKIVAEEIEVAGIKDAAIVGESVFAEGKVEVFVETTAVKDNSRIFITPKGGVNTQVISLSHIESGLGFYVIVKNAMEKEVPFNWFVIEDNTVDKR